MTINDRRALKAEATRILARTPNQKRLVLIYTGVSAILSLLTALLTYFLDQGIAGTGGLSGFQLRSVLTTAQEILSTVTSLALPFWGLGYTYAMLRISRRQPVTEGALLEGFRRFGPGLRLMLLEGLLMGGIFTFCIYFAIFVLGMTPIAAPAYAILDPIMADLEQNPNLELDAATTMALFEALLPILVCGLVAACVILVPLSYRLRFSQLRLMDEPQCGARQAMITSFGATRGSCMALFRLDLHFWWFWLANSLILVVTFGDLILSFLGIPLSLTPTTASWAFSLAATALQVILYTACYNRVSATYALAYSTLLPQTP